MAAAGEIGTTSGNLSPFQKNFVSIISWGADGDIPVPGDYDGDGKADPAVFRPKDGTWRILGSAGVSWTNSLGVPGDMPVQGDYDGDDKIDPAIYRPLEGLWRIQGSLGNSWDVIRGAPGDLPVPEDYDGDGKWDAAIYTPADGTWQFFAHDLRSWKITWGKPGDIPLPRDYNGDGKADAGVFRPSEGSWQLSILEDTRLSIRLGASADIPVPGDYNGDGVVDLAIWQSEGRFQIKFINGGNEIVGWGGPGDLPVPADYNGDGKMDVAIFRPSDGTWHIPRAARTPVTDGRHYSSQRWQTEEGLPHNIVYAVLQSRDGYLWLGTHQGLARFDGVRFVIPERPELKGQPVLFLHQTKDETIWIGTDRRLFCRKEGHFFQSPIATNTQVKAMYESRDGTLWIGTLGGLLHYKDGRLTSYTHADGLPASSVLAICEDRDGTLWFGTSRGLVRYEDKFTPVEHSGLLNNSIRALYCDRENNLWIGTGGGGLGRFSNGQLREFRKTAGVSDGFVTTILEDSRGELWVGTMSGLCRRTGDTFVSELNREGASYESVFSLIEDREGSLWIATKEGLNQAQRKPFHSRTKLDGLSHNNVMSVCESRRGEVWVATWGGGLNETRETKTIVYNRANSPLYDLLLSIHETRDGALWLGADYDGGLFQFKNGRFTRYGKDEGIIDQAIRVIYEDRQTNLWVGTSGGLYRKQDGKFARFSTADGLAGNTIRALCEDQEGNLWIGTSEGLSKKETEDRSQESGVPSHESRFTNHASRFLSYTTKNGLSSNKVLALHEDRDRDLWIGTDGGLSRFRDGKFTSYFSKDGLFSDSIFEILEDDHGNLWMSCFSGVFRVKKKELDDFDRGKIQAISCAAYGKADGMASVQCNGVSKPAGWKGKDGRLWFPTTRGVVVVDPNSIRENVAPPPVVIEQIIADKKTVTSDVWRVTGKESHPVTRHLSPVTIQPGRGELEFHYTALSFSAPEKNRFKYKLEGVDSDWIEATGRRIAFYNHIRPGHYVFHVIACNNDGVWNQPGANVKLSLEPHFWQTKWFLGLAALALIGGVAGSARYVTWRRVKEKLLRLEQQHAVEKERARIAQDMHDDLGARLTEILMLSGVTASGRGGESGMKSNAEKVVVAAEDMVRNMDGIVWAINPRNDSLKHLTLYFYEYVERFLGPTDIRCRWEVPKDLPELSLTAEVRHNLFLVLKEALNNVVKHSGASEVWLRFSLEDSILEIGMEDNGRGVSQTQGGRIGNGLINMRKRMEEVKGNFLFESAPGKGTRLRLQIPLRR